jgi:predicted metal-dependent enzyme (double-stranded beta helix superfamily)
MSYSLEDFCDQTRAILLQNDDHDGRESIRQKLELLLNDPTFCSTYVGSDNDPGVNQIFEDSNLKFCVLTYNMPESRTSPPHDHGRSWAVYGQAAQYTDMTIWSAAGNDDDKIEPIRQFRLEPGQAGLFDAGEIHSIEYPDDAKFVRVTGVDMSTESRRVFDPAKGTMRKVEQVGTDDAR